MGTLLHFLYDWTEIRLVAPFSAVNESIWEHMKLLFFPMLIFAILQNRYFVDDYPNFWCVKLVGALLALTTVPVLYYTYTGALGVSADWFNIAIFFIAAAVCYLVETRLMQSDSCLGVSPLAAKALLGLIVALFVAFTFSPPRIPLFQDPLTKLYGLG